MKSQIRIKSLIIWLDNSDPLATREDKSAEMLTFSFSSCFESLDILAIREKIELILARSK